MTTAAIQKKTGTLALFSFTLFLSAALMFGLQPMVGKMLLPIVGGTPAGWIVAMAFFQVMLLAGYFLAHALSRYSPRKQAVFYILCLVAGVPFLPTSLAAHAGLVSETPEAFDTFLLLTIVVGVPFVALSATASTLQRLFMTTGHRSAEDPYFLYAASNFGSFAGLLLYPFLIEPRWTLTAQSHGWLAGYVLLAVSAAVCLSLADKEKKPAPVKKGKLFSANVGWKKRVEWISLAFIPSALLLAVTMHITTDILSVPLLWVIPLSIYLLTYVVAFSKKAVIPYSWIMKLQPPVAAIALSLVILFKTVALQLAWGSLGAHLLFFAITALMCHMRLARARPVKDPDQLTEFYLMLAVGGALGGIINAFIAPMIFNTLAEYPILILAAAFFNEDMRKSFSDFHAGTFFSGVLLMGAFILMGELMIVPEVTRDILVTLMFVLLTLHPRALQFLGLLSVVGFFLQVRLNPPVLTARNFYGIIKVYDTPFGVGNGIIARARNMQNGTTLHGVQILDRGLDTTPTTYYTEQGPLGDIMNTFNPKNVASVGLGAGTTNCYSTPKRKITFFDINAAVVKIAKEKFTFLSKCGNGMPRIILGDARLELKKYEGEKFDLIILDAFSSDNIPTHLLTKEAIELYLQRLTPDGIILFHISNRHFLLDGPLAAAASELGLQNAVAYQNQVQVPYAVVSRWLAMSRSGVDFQSLGEKGWMQVLPKDTKPWTDDYTDLLGVMDFSGN